MNCGGRSRIRRAPESCMKGWEESSNICLHSPQDTRGEFPLRSTRSSIGSPCWTNVERFEDVGHRDEYLRIRQRSAGTLSIGRVKAQICVLGREKYRLPKPKKISRGSVTSSASFPAFMNQFGSKVEADGYKLSSRNIPLHWLIVNKLPNEVQCIPTRC